MLTVLLVSGGISWSTAQEAKPLTAVLLVARSELPDPNFSDSIVLVMNNIGPAPVGIIVNRPMPLSVSELFPKLKQLAHVHEKVYFGGPVALESVWFLFRAKKAPEHAAQAVEDVYLSGDLDLLLRLLNRDKPMDGLRIFMGHSGWGPGQLEAEIARGDWSLQHAKSDAIFDRKSEHPWPAPHTPGRTT